jgi:hypothetical protein
MKCNAPYKIGDRTEIVGLLAIRFLGFFLWRLWIVWEGGISRL